MMPVEVEVDETYVLFFSLSEGFQADHSLTVLLSSQCRTSAFQLPKSPTDDRRSLPPLDFSSSPTSRLLPLSSPSAPQTPFPRSHTGQSAPRHLSAPSSTSSSNRRLLISPSFLLLPLLLSAQPKLSTTAPSSTSSAPSRRRSRQMRYHACRLLSCSHSCDSR